MRPENIAAGIGIILIIISIVWFIMKWKELTDFERLVTFILICILIAITVVVYYAVDIYYEINPLILNWNKVNDYIGRLRSSINI